MAQMWGFCDFAGDWYEVGAADSQRLRDSTTCPACGRRLTQFRVFTGGGPEPTPGARHHCLTCRYFEAGQANGVATRECHRFPPTFFSRRPWGRPEAKFIPVEASMWCGEWAPRVEPQADVLRVPEA